MLNTKNVPAFNADDEDCFLRMLNSPKQQRCRAVRRRKDADRERMYSVPNMVSVLALVLVIVLLIICALI